MLFFVMVGVRGVALSLFVSAVKWSSLCNSF